MAVRVEFEVNLARSEIRRERNSKTMLHVALTSNLPILILSNSRFFVSLNWVAITTRHKFIMKKDPICNNRGETILVTDLMMLIVSLFLKSCKNQSFVD